MASTMEFMSLQLICEELTPDQWMRVRDVRLASLLDSPGAYGANFDAESKFDEEMWRDLFNKLSFLVTSTDGKDIAVMSVESLDGDFGATCWVGGCWSDPKFRGIGAMKTMFSFMDLQSQTRGWGVQGLGVWTDNFSAIAAYEKLGFTKMGEPQESTRVPGKLYQRMIRQASIKEGKSHDTTTNF